MKRNWFAILFCISLIFSLSGLKGKSIQNMKMEFAALEQNSNEMICCSQDLPEDKAGQVSLKNLTTQFDGFYLGICDYFTLSTFSVSPRGVSFSKPLKSTHSLQIHSSLRSPLFSKNSGVQCFHYCFVEASCRYYIYTLRRIII